VKRSFTIKGHRTSISIEAPFWDALRHAASASNHRRLVAAIDAKRETPAVERRAWGARLFPTVGGKHGKTYVGAPYPRAQ
jgi:hypothetical protein